MEYREFLNRLFGNISDDARILIHQLPSRSSRFFDTSEKAANYVDTILNGSQNIYTTAGLLRPGIKKGRGKKEDVVGVVAFGIDIDLKRPEKPRGVGTIEEAKALVCGHGWDPTLIIFTGNGIQAWWIFKEPLMFENDEQRKDCELICKRIQETVRRLAKKSNWDIDSTHEINRVLRIPKTYNRKDPANPLEVKLILDTGIEYDDPEEDFEEFIIPSDQVTPRPDTTAVVVSNGLNLVPDAQPPGELFADLVLIDPKFGVTFVGRRGANDTKKWKDTSASSYTMSLANAMARANWTDQEMADTIISFYRENENNPNIEGNPTVQKALRPDYIINTIKLARKSVQITTQATAAVTLDTVPNDPSIVKEINQRHAAVMIGSRFRVLRESKSPTMDGIDVKYLRIRDLAALYDNQRVPRSSGGKNPVLKMVNPAAIWMSHKDRRQYESVVFAPEGTPNGYYNLWQGFHIKPVAGDCSLYLEHMQANICAGDKGDYEYLFDWMADGAAQHQRQTHSQYPAPLARQGNQPIQNPRTYDGCNAGKQPVLPARFASQKTERSASVVQPDQIKK